jgi:type III secretion protein C
VADLLQKILTGDTGAVGGVAQTLPTLSGTPRLAKGTGVVGRANALKEAEAEAAPPAARGTAFIQADPRLNAVLVWDYEDNLPFIQEIVESLDQPLPLVEIRAAIIDIEAGKTSDLGISLRYQGDKGRWENTAGSNLGSSSSPVDFSNISGNGFQYATIYSWGLDQLMARVSAMEEDGNANILSRPSVLTQDNIQATLEHTETFYVRLQGEREVDLADITTGLTLRVTPHVINNGEGGVQLAVYITDGDDANSNVDGLPRVRQSSISTQAIVHEGEALVIGGYYNETRRLTDTGVPGLKNIPLFGALFRNKEKTNNKSERLFVLSPRIITPGQSPYAPGSESERSLDYSPARDLLQGPAMPDPVPEKKPGRGGKKR